jgi:predicted lysophospholipase L1 biosynthesis ABC-type transport system permease subunit
MRLKVTAIVQQEPEVASGILAIAPRLLINLDDVPATNLMQPGNRASYRLLVADLSTRKALNPYLDWLQPLAAGQRMENVRDLRPEVRQTLERAEKFLGLSALVAVILAAVAVALAASRYLRRHLDAAAMLRCLRCIAEAGARAFVLQFGALGLVASASGIVGGARGPATARDAARVDYRDGASPPGSFPRSRRSAPACLLLFGFALPPLHRARRCAAAARLAARSCRAAARRSRCVPARRCGDRVADRVAGAGRDRGRDHGRRHRRAARALALVRVGADRAAEALAAARRDMALRTRESAPAARSLEPADRLRSRSD